MAAVSLSGRVYIVSGASRGMGREMAHALLLAGASVTILAPQRDAQELRATAAEIGRDVGADRVLAVVGDNTSPAACAGVVERTIETFGAVHGVVNNAGLGPLHVRPENPQSTIPFWEAPPDRWADVIGVNVIGTFNMARAVAPSLVESRWGRIVNVSTSLSTMTREGGTPYGPSKAAIEAMTLSWSQELAPYGVTANSLLPGGTTDTAFVHADVRRTRPMISPAVMRAPIVWLLSPRSDAFTGRRFIAKNWPEAMDPDAAATAALEPSVFRAP